MVPNQDTQRRPVSSADVIIQALVGECFQKRRESVTAMCACYGSILRKRSADFPQLDGALSLGCHLVVVLRKKSLKNLNQHVLE